jgi:hypothetical protein
MRLRRSFRVLVLLAALAGLSVFAAAAVAAETKVGEGALPGRLSLPGEVDLIKGTASYQVDTGAMTFGFTTREAPMPKPGPAEEEGEGEFAIQYQGSLFNTAGNCNLATISGQNPEVQIGPPVFTLVGFGGGPEAEGLGAVGIFFAGFAKSEQFQSIGTKAAEGATTTFTTISPHAVNQPFDCALMAIPSDEASEAMIFPIAAKSEPPAPHATPAPVAPPPPQPAPASLLIAKPKALKLKAGKSKTVKIKLSNPAPRRRRRAR